MNGRFVGAAGLVLLALMTGLARGEFQIATFQVDVTPPVGTPLCDALVPPATGVADPLSARGMLIQPADGQPIVLVAVDWVGIANTGHDAWREALAAAAGTPIERVCVHCVHQHDAPGCDFLSDEIAAQAGLAGGLFDVEYARQAIRRTAEAIKQAKGRLRTVTHVGYGQGRVEKVASNRRILGADGKVQFGRMTTTVDPKIRAFPEGTIDPFVRLVSFHCGQDVAAVLSYYATHPQSYYRTGKMSADFVGMARDERQEAEHAALHIHFNGAGGNIGAGKYNDGSPENRPILAARLSAGMKSAWEQRTTIPAETMPLDWSTRSVQLPLAEWYDEKESLALLADTTQPLMPRLQAARDIAWARRSQNGHAITIARWRLGPIDILHLPGELFVEYQLAAQKLRPDAFVCTAAYGDYGPGYIGTAQAYTEGGYETSTASRVPARSEPVLSEAIQALLQ